MVCFSPSNLTSSVFLSADNDLTEESPAAPAALFSTIFGVIGEDDEEADAEAADGVVDDDDDDDDDEKTKSFVVNSPTAVKNDADLFSLEGAPFVGPPCPVAEE